MTYSSSPLGVEKHQALKNTFMGTAIFSATVVAVTVIDFIAGGPAYVVKSGFSLDA